MLAWRVSTTLVACRFKETRSARKRSKNGPLRRPLAIGDSMTTLGSSVQPVGNLLHTHDLYDHLRAVPPAIAPYADPLNFCSPRIAARRDKPSNAEPRNPGTPSTHRRSAVPPNPACRRGIPTRRRPGARPPRSAWSRPGRGAGGGVDDSAPVTYYTKSDREDLSPPQARILSRLIREEVTRSSDPTLRAAGGVPGRLPGRYR